jgi:hypothetical protein
MPLIILPGIIQLATRQAVQRELAMLARARLVERHGNRWTLVDIGRLQSV